MAEHITNDLRSILESRNPENVSVLIESEPGRGGEVEDYLTERGYEYERSKVGNLVVFEAVIPATQVQAVGGRDGIIRVDHNPTFQALGAAMPVGEGGMTEAAGATRTDTFTATKELGVEVVWDDLGHRGEGVTIGMLDTPIDTTHEALRHADIETHSQGNAGDHGTWVAGALIAEDTDARGGKRVRGVAPDANLVASGVLSGGKATFGTIAEGVNDLLNSPSNVDIINLSFGGPHSSTMHSLMGEIRRQGVHPDTSAGNSGPGSATVTCPAHHDETLAVASVNFDGDVAAFSSRGPGWTDAPSKPDVSSYGGHTVIEGGQQVVTQSILGPGSNGTYTRLIGTSMATPFVTGVGALRIASNRGE
jgi:subtilisin family serine protease